MRSIPALPLFLALVSGAAAQNKPAVPRLANLWLNPSLNSGKRHELVVYLSQPAPAGVAVQLTSSKPEVVVVPSSLKVPEGRERASVYFEVQKVAAPVEVTVTATWGGNTVAKTVQILLPAPARLTNLWLNPSLNSGRRHELVVYFSPPAPAGVAVQLASSKPEVVVVPSSLAIPEGRERASAYFEVQKVAAPVEVTVTATWGGSTVAKTVQILPPEPAKLLNLWVNATLKGGTSTELVLYFSEPLPGGGATALISSSNPAVLPVPATITAGEGATRVGHYVKVPAIEAPAEITITVSWNGSTIAKTTRIVP